MFTSRVRGVPVGDHRRPSQTRTTRRSEEEEGGEGEGRKGGREDGREDGREQEGKKGGREEEEDEEGLGGLDVFRHAFRCNEKRYPLQNRHVFCSFE